MTQEPSYQASLDWLKSLGWQIGESYNPTDPDNAKSPEDLGRLLLSSVGLVEPFTADEISAAIAANDSFVDALERIRDQRS